MDRESTQSPWMARRSKALCSPVPSPTCGGRSALSAGYPGASCQLVLKKLLVEAILRGVAAHQEQRQASAGSEGMAGDSRQFHSLRGLRVRGHRSYEVRSQGSSWGQKRLRTPHTLLELLRGQGAARGWSDRRPPDQPWSQQVYDRPLAISTSQCHFFS